uniref:Uncharacterized protein n=1 Tax=Paenibacillus athensensis TaxID=1967502 RepID=A0A4Y8Q9I0_9BACL
MKARIWAENNAIGMTLPLSRTSTGESGLFAVGAEKKHKQVQKKASQDNKAYLTPVSSPKVPLIMEAVYANIRMMR